MKNFWFSQKFCYYANLLAESKIKNHSFANEWKIAIVLSLVIRVITVFFSSYSAYFFYRSWILPVVENIYVATTLSILFAVIIELLTLFFLEKTFKFFIKRQFNTALAAFCGAVMMYSLSFVATTNGIAERQMRLVDKTNYTIDSKKDRLKQLELKRDAEIAELEKEISLIKANPEGWVRNKRVILTNDQQSRIAEYRALIYKLTNDYNTQRQVIDENVDRQINKNRIEMQNEGLKYWKVALIILIFQYLSTGFLIFAYSRIYKEIHEKELLDEKIVRTIHTIDTNVEGIFLSRINDMVGRFTSQFALFNHTKQVIQLPASDDESTLPASSVCDGNQKPILHAEDERKIGFRYGMKKNNDVVTCNASKQSESSEKTEINDPVVKIEKREYRVKQTANCLYCNAEFTVLSWTHKFCSVKCKNSHHSQFPRKKKTEKTPISGGA